MKFVDFPLADKLSAAAKDRLRFYNQMMEQTNQMNEIEQKVYTAIQEIKRLLTTMVDNVEDNEQIRLSTTTLSDQLQKVVGRRIIKESIRKNG